MGVRGRRSGDGGHGRRFQEVQIWLPRSFGKHAAGLLPSRQPSRQTSESALTRPSLSQVRINSPAAGPNCPPDGGRTYQIISGASAIGSAGSGAAGCDCAGCEQPVVAGRAQRRVGWAGPSPPALRCGRSLEHNRRRRDRGRNGLHGSGRRRRAERRCWRWLRRGGRRAAAPPTAGREGVGGATTGPLPAGVPGGLLGPSIAPPPGSPGRLGGSPGRISGDESEAWADSASSGSRVCVAAWAPAPAVGRLRGRPGALRRDLGPCPAKWADPTHSGLKFLDVQLVSVGTKEAYTHRSNILPQTSIITPHG